MEEEFQEADVLWPDPDVVVALAHHDCHCHRHRPADDSSHGHRREQHPTGQQQQRPRAAVVVHPPLQSSPPVRIPSMPPVGPTSRDSWTRSYYGDGAEIVPPHVMAARRCAEDQRRVASSVCVGHGRTLKGRDLRAVRNAVLHMTGFLSSSDKY